MKTIHYRKWVRDYGVRRGTGVLIAHLQQMTMIGITRVGMFITGTMFGFDDMWDDYLHDNYPMCWDDERFAAYSDETMTAAHELLIHFVREEMCDDFIHNLFMLKR